MYLTRAAMRSTLNDVASRSSPGSTIIVNYHTTMRRGIAGLILRAMREPVRSAYSPVEMAEELSAAGFTVTEDSGGPDWAARYATESADVRAGRIMRVVVATTTSSRRNSACADPLLQLVEPARDDDDSVALRARARQSHDLARSSADVERAVG